jgi:hypothetical protein
MAETGEVRHVVVDETTWPVPDEVEWVLRYGTPERREAVRYGVASIVSAYWSLLDPNRTQADAVAMLKRARRAVAAPRPTHDPEVTNDG